MTMRAFYHVTLALLSGTCAAAAQPTAQSGAAERSVPAAESDALYRLGKEMFERFASPEMKAQYEFPTKEQWDAAAARFQRALEGTSLEELAACSADAREALKALRTFGVESDLADWLEQRIDEAEGAQEAVAPVKKPPAPPPPTRPGKAVPTAVQPVPHYNMWLARVRDRPVPSRAASLVPKLQQAFRAEGVPAELVWLAEAESSFNTSARSPVGAKGLFQLMPETARSLGLSTVLPDDRTNPEKSARAAARYLRMLHGKFGNWALALAAYNAGEGRVARLLAARNARTFTAIAEALPAETRMYVPKVCALIATRAGISPDRIGRPAATK